MRPFRPRPTFGFLAACLLFPVMVVTASAQVPDDIRAALTGRGHALLIGVSDYSDSAWGSLPNVSDNITVLQNSLAPHFATVDTLPNPTAAALFTKLREFLLGEWNRSDERLLVYYAGHGFTAFNQNSHVDVGYITGSDTPGYKNNWNSAIANAISFQDIDALNRGTQARQVLMLFDSCFSGSLFATRSGNVDPKRYDYEHARDALHQPVRYYITAGGSTETIPAISPFAELVARGLGGEADIYKDGFITGEELGRYLQHQIPVYTHQSLHPLKGPILDANLNSGEFIFMVSPTAAAAKAQQEEQARQAAGVAKERVEDVLKSGKAALVDNDFPTAMRSFRKPADEGNADAQFYIGMLYQNGWGVAKDNAEAVRWYRKAADQGNAAAQDSLGDGYQYGWGVALDYAEAIRWYRKAADQGFVNSQYALGVLYQQGRPGVAKDNAEAMRWYRQAADQGNANAKQALMDLEKHVGHRR